MSKEKKPNSNKKTGKSTGSRFGKRRENYVDSFRWGFVEGEPVEDVGPDDELYYGEPDEEEASAPENKGRDNKGRQKKAGKAAPPPKTESRVEKGADVKPKESARSRKKQAKKTVPAPPTLPFFDDDDDDDLNLPSYGRTPIPTDDELPQPIKKKSVSKPNASQTPPPQQAPRGKTEKAEKAQPSQKSAPRKSEETRRSETPRSETPKDEHREPGTERKSDVEKSERPRRVQMVWDPDKREYVPLVVPEPVASKKKAGRERSREKPVEKERPSAPPPAPVAREKPTRQERVEREPERREPQTRQETELPKKAKRSSRKKTARTESAEPVKVATPPAAPITEPTATSESDRSDRRRNDKKGSKKSLHAAQQRADVPPMVESNVPDPSDIEADVRGFAELGVSETMLEALKVVRYLEPTPIQSGVFKQVQAGTDVMGQAQTGTGKTAAFSIPIIEGIEECPPGNDPVALILVPTRELAVQVRDEAARLCYGRDVRIAACYGGKPIAKQISKLRDGIDIVVGTPGRILDLMNRRALSLDALRWVVLDEADRMLDIGFRPDIEKILKRTPKERQTLLFSATLPPPVVRLAERYMKTPEILDFSNKGVAVDTIEQYYVTVDPERKFDALLYLLEEEQPNQAIIFTRTKRGADRLARHLSKRMDSLAAIHGDLSQGERDRVMGQFRTGKLRYLVATDVVGRGIDVSGISHIINFDIPAFCDDYVHRVGRTGRMGREGVAYTFVTVQEGSELTRIEMRIDKLLKRADLKGFESYTKPSDPNANIDDLMSETPTESKPVYGKPVRKIRRAL